MTLLLPILLLTSQASTISVTFPPTPLPKALAILSQASGRKLESVPVMADEVVLARLKDAPVDTALSHLAEALCAKWETRPDGALRLVYDPTAQRKLDQADEAEKEKYFKVSIAYLHRRLAQQPDELDKEGIRKFLAKKAAEERRREAAQAANDYDHAWLPMDSEEETPGWRVGAGLALRLDARQLLAMPKDSREIWAENPTAMQHAFPDGCDALLARYRREQALLHPDVTIARIKLTVLNEGDSFYTYLTARDATGKGIERTVVRLDGHEDWSKTPTSTRPEFAIKQGELPLDIPQEAKEVRIALSDFQVYRKPDRQSMLDKWWPRLMDPIHNEPTHWHDGMNLIKAAERFDKQLIGTVNDYIQGRFGMISTRLNNPEKLMPTQVLAKHAEDFLPTNDGWLVTRSHWRMPRASRAAAKGMLADCARKGGVTVDATAAWVAQSTDRRPMYNWFGDYLRAMFFGPGTYGSMQMIDDSESLRLWSSLGPGVMDSLRRGSTLRVSALPSEAQRKVFELAYWFHALDENRDSTFVLDATESLPNGISDGVVNLTVTELPVIGAWSSKGGSRRHMSQRPVQAFGMGLADKNAGTFFRSLDRFQIGVYRTYALHFVLNPGAVPMTIDLSECLIDPDAPMLNELPQDLKNEVEKARLEAIAHPQVPHEIGPAYTPPAKRVVPPGP